MLRVLERRATDRRVGALERSDERLRELRAATRYAEERYEAAVLTFGKPSDSDFWLVAYLAMIQRAHTLVTEMRAGATALPTSARFSAATDVEMLEQLMSTWREAIRSGVVRGAA